MNHKFKYPNRKVPCFLLEFEKRDLLKAGTFVHGSLVEEILECPFKEGDWEFLGRYLTMKSQIESKGFFITQSGIEPPGFRILNTREMARHGMKKLFKSMGTNYKVGHILAVHRGETLSEKEQKYHDSIQEKAARVTLMQQNVLIDNFFFN